MHIIHNVNLQPFHTFGTEVYAAAYTELHHIEELYQLKSLKEKYGSMLIMGGGSNVLFLKNFSGIVIHNRLKGIEITEETEEFVTLKAASGINWHDFVLYTVSNNWGGIENLSLIPGTVGAAPMQNIGAYGTEVRNVITEVRAFETETQQWMDFSNEECHFGYRESIFKYPDNKDKYFITHVTFRLKKSPEVFLVSYGDIQKTLEEMQVNQLSVKSISDAVIHIRNQKLPDPKQLGNAGSFFKNPEVSKWHAEELLLQYPQMPHYSLENEHVKIPAGWLIEQCGWKGLRSGATGNHSKQALVIVNYGTATGEEIRQHAENVQKSVLEKFNILLHPEVNYISG